jgi:hypothetical protein
MILDECSISPDVDWWRGTCSDDRLFLSSAAEWGSSVYEFDLHSSFQLIKSWHAPMTCENDENICDLKYNDTLLHMAIF